MTKKVSFPRPAVPKAADADAWVGAGAEDPRQTSLQLAPVEEAQVEMKRLTIDIPVELHRRVKSQCATRGMKMADVVRDLLDREFQA